jgi:hypothetical protein
MTTTKTGASLSGGASARSNGKVKTVTVRGIKLVLPAKVSFGSMRHLLKDDGTVGDVMGFLEAVLGDEQMQKVWAIDLDSDDLLEETRKVIDELGGKVAGKLGLTLGE